MNAQIEKAKSKLLKAATLINDAHRILIRETGGHQAVLGAEEATLKAAASLVLWEPATQTASAAGTRSLGIAPAPKEEV